MYTIYSDTEIRPDMYIVRSSMYSICHLLCITTTLKIMLLWCAINDQFGISVGILLLHVTSSFSVCLCAFSASSVSTCTCRSAPAIRAYSSNCQYPKQATFQVPTIPMPSTASRYSRSGRKPTSRWTMVRTCSSARRWRRAASANEVRSSSTRCRDRTHDDGYPGAFTAGKADYPCRSDDELTSPIILYSHPVFFLL